MRIEVADGGRQAAGRAPVNGTGARSVYSTTAPRGNDNPAAMETAPEIEALRMRAGRGDGHALERLLRALRPRAFRWALVRTGDSDEAEDVCQDVLVRVERGLARFDGRSSTLTWLYSIVRNTVIERARRVAAKERMKRGLAREAEASGSRVRPEDGPGELEAVVREFLGELPAKQREAFNLVDLEGLAPAEAAELVGANPSTFRVHLLRARRRMRSALLERAPEMVEGRG